MVEMLKKSNYAGCSGILAMKWFEAKPDTLDQSLTIILSFKTGNDTGNSSLF